MTTVRHTGHTLLPHTFYFATIVTVTNCYTGITSIMLLSHSCSWQCHHHHWRMVTIFHLTFQFCKCCCHCLAAALLYRNAIKESIKRFGLSVDNSKKIFAFFVICGLVMILLTWISVVFHWGFIGVAQLIVPSLHISPFRSHQQWQAELKKTGIQTGLRSKKGMFYHVE